MEQPPSSMQEDNSLEAPPTPEQAPTPAPQASPQSPTPAAPSGGAPRPKGLYWKLRGLIGHFNPYLLGFILLVILTGIGFYVVVTVRKGGVETPTDTPTSSKLTSDALKQLNNSDVKIGDPKQVLGIESNTVFSGKVLIRDSLDVAGGLKLGGALSLPGLTVAGTSIFDQIQGNSLAISGNAAVQGQLTVQRGISVTGGGSFGGPITAPQITVDTLQLTRDLTITRHIDAGGGTPGKADGNALGGGGTSSVSGTDTAGTIVINTGGGPAAGCYITVNFAQRFNGTPHIALTPANSSAAGMNYYVNRSATNFSVCSATVPAAGQNHTFDYIVID